MALTGNLRVTEAESREHDEVLYAKKTVPWAANYQARYEYDVDGNITYAGYAARSIASSTASWILHKFTYSGSDVTVRQIAYDSWDNRASASYA